MLGRGCEREALCKNKRERKKGLRSVEREEEN